MSNSLPSGSKLGEYQIQEEVGRGGMAAVYRGYDPMLDRNVAVKVLAPYLVWQEGFTERFLREARAAARLEHPNIVHIYGVGQERGWYYYVMEYLEGQPLTEYIHRRGPLPPGQVIAILRPMADALDYAHQEGLVHRDVKPGNILMGRAGRVTLTDFGIAQAAQETRLTSTGTVVGTPEYISPEQARGVRANPRSDQYSLAVVAYEMLSGRVPFQAENTLAVLLKVASEAPPPIRQMQPGLPAEVEAVLARGLAKRPEDRFPTVSTFVDALEQALAGQPVEAVPVPPSMQPTRPQGMIRQPEGATAPAKPSPAPHRLPAWLVGLGVLALILLMIGGAMAAFGGGSRDPTPTLAPTSVAVLPTATSKPATATLQDIPSPTLKSSTAQATATLAPVVKPGQTATPSPVPPTPTATPTSTTTPSRSPTPPLQPSRTPSPSPGPTIGTVPAATLSAPTAEPPATPTVQVQSRAATGRIAFAVFEAGTGKYTLYSVDANGGGLRWLGDQLRQPSYRQDGKMIVANGQGAGRNDLWMVKPDGSGLEAAMGEPDDEHPVWLQSEGGYQVAFDSLRWGDGQWRIYVADSPLYYGSGVIRGRYPIWLPADKIVYNGCNYGFASGSNCGLFKVSMWGGTPVQVLDDPGDIPTGGGEAGILFMRQVEGNWDIFLVGAAGGTPRRLTDHAAQDGLGTFSPDGRIIAFLSNRSGNWAIWLMNRDGSHQEKLVDLPGEAGNGAEWVSERLSWAPLPASGSPVATPVGGDLLPPPEILFPIPEDTIPLRRPITVRWSWSQALADNQGFELRFWHATDPAPLGVAPPTAAQELDVNFGLTETYQQHGVSTYLLDVVVVQINPYKVMSRSSAIHVRIDPNK